MGEKERERAIVERIPALVKQELEEASRDL